MHPTFGCEFEDRITGFKGICTGRAEYISGCTQLLITPKLKEPGESTKAEWFDEQRLKQVGGKRITLDNGSTPGHDRAAPVR